MCARIKHLDRQLIVIIRHPPGKRSEIVGSVSLSNTIYSDKLANDTIFNFHKRDIQPFIHVSIVTLLVATSYVSISTTIECHLLEINRIQDGTAFTSCEVIFLRNLIVL